jgi:hypothetical protein
MVSFNPSSPAPRSVISQIKLMNGRTSTRSFTCSHITDIFNKYTEFYSMNLQLKYAALAITRTSLQLNK